MNAKQFNIEIINKKLSQIKGYLDDLEIIKNFSLEEYQSDVFRKRGIEKTLINIIQASVDINNYILVKLKKVAPNDSFDSFLKLGEFGILPKDLINKIAPSTGLRSHLVHEYDKIEDSIVYSSISKAFNQFPQYMKYIKKFIDKINQEQLF